jgi:hypothetical protein
MLRAAPSASFWYDWMREMRVLLALVGPDVSIKL